ncbi:hypothetical protein ACFX15_031134 [Malus domestica]
MEESGQGFYPFYSLSWGLGLYWVFNLGVEILYLGTIGFDVGLTVWHKFGLCEDGVKVGSDKSQSIECWDGLYGAYEMLVGSVKGAHPLLSPNGRYVQADAFIDIVIALFLAITDDLRQIQELRLSPVKANRVFSEHSKYSAASLRLSKVWSLLIMENPGVEELVVHLDRSLNLSTMEIGVKLVGMALTQKPLNRWGIINILTSVWKDLCEVGIKWVRVNVFIISAPDQSVAKKILAQVPWAVMKKNFVVKAWPSDLALEEVDMKTVPFWVQIWGIPLSLVSKENVTRLIKTAGVFLEMEDPAKARGFLRVRVLVNSENPLVLRCWLKMEVNCETWVEFRYERLQDFCYHCGRIDHINTECSFAANIGGAEGYGDWIKAPPVREFVEHVRPSRLGVGERRLVGMVRGSDRPELRLQRLIHNEAPSRKDTSGVTAGELGSHVREKKKWRRFQRQDCPASQIQGGEGEHSIRIRDVSEADSGTPPVGDLEVFTGTLASTSRLCSSLLRHEVGGIKRGVEPSSMDLVPSPQKKTRWPNPDADRQVIQDGTMEVSDMWDQVEADAGENGSCVLTVCAGNLARGGGGWPSTAARSP